MGSIVRAKVLGSLALIDEGETDHKIVVIRESDPHFKKINTLDDLEKYNKNCVADLIHWLKYYKTSDGKGVNTLANDEIPKTSSEAIEIIHEVEGFYESLLDGSTTIDDVFSLPGNTNTNSNTNTDVESDDDVSTHKHKASNTNTNTKSKKSSKGNGKGSHGYQPSDKLGDLTDDEE